MQYDVKIRPSPGKPDVVDILVNTVNIFFNAKLILVACSFHMSEKKILKFAETASRYFTRILIPRV